MASIHLRTQASISNEDICTAILQFKYTRLILSKIGECDVFFTCRLGVGIPTKCSEGLHYSEEVAKLIFKDDGNLIIEINHLQ